MAGFTDGSHARTGVPLPGTRGAAMHPDELHQLFADRRRRFVAHLLKRRSDGLSIHELARTIVAWERGIDLSTMGEGSPAPVVTDLAERHLPALAAHDLVEYDETAGTVGGTDRLDSIDIYVTPPPERRLPWSGAYLALSVLGLVGLGASWVGLGFVGALPAMVLASGLVLALTVIALAHARSKRRRRLGTAGRPPELRGD